MAKSKEELIYDIENNLVDSDTGKITGERVKARLLDMVETMAESAGSGGGGASQLEYWSFPNGMPAEIAKVAMLSTLAKFNLGRTQILPTAVAIAFGVMEFSAIALDLTLVVSGDTGFATLGEQLAGLDLAAAGGISITKEQFYTI